MLFAASDIIRKRLFLLKKRMKFSLKSSEFNPRRLWTEGADVIYLRYQDIMRKMYEKCT